jgi:hypothetical protein
MRIRPQHQKRKSTAYSITSRAPQVAIEIDGGNAMMTRWEAFLRQIHTMALNKDASAARLVHQIRDQFPGMPAAGDKITYVISETDKRL